MRRRKPTTDVGVPLVIAIEVLVMRRREVIAGVAAASAFSPGAWAQIAPNVKFILWVSTEAQPDPFIAGFREGMRERGYVEGQNLAFVLRYAPGDPAALRAMLPELLNTRADLIVSSGPAILAMRATTDKPVLFAISGDPVALGIAQSLSRPGRNFTAAPSSRSTWRRSGSSLFASFCPTFGRWRSCRSR